MALSLLICLIASMGLSHQAESSLDMHAMAKISEEKYINCLVYHAVKAYDGKADAKEVVLRSKEKCYITLSMYKYFIKRDEAAREGYSAAETELALEILEQIMIEDATKLVVPLIESVADRRH